MTTANATSPNTARAACSPTRITSGRRVSAPRIEAAIEKMPQISARQTARRPSSAMTSGGRLARRARLLRLVLRGAAGHDLLRGERALAVVSLDDDLAAFREHVGEDAAARDRHGLAAVLARELAA